MWLYRRIFAGVVALGLLLGSLFFLGVQVGERRPEFLRNATRFRMCATRGLLIVASPPDHAHTRQVIRETWAHPSVLQPLDMGVAFGVGSSDDPEVQRPVDWEAEVYGDVLQDEGPSGILPSLKAVRSACAPLPEFVMKLDDEVFVNSYVLAELLEYLETSSSSNTLWCLEWNRQLDRVGGNVTWVVTRSRSNEGARPAFCLGSLYLMTGRALDALVRRHESRPGLLQQPEDSYVTGVLSREARLSFSLLGERFAFDPRAEEVDPAKVTLAYLGRGVEAETRKLWSALARSDLGL